VHIAGGCILSDRDGDLMPESNGLEATRELLRSDRQAALFLTTLHEIPSFVEEARRVGAAMFFSTESGRHLIPAVRVARQRKPFFTPMIWNLPNT